MLCSDIIHACLHAEEESIPQTGARGRQAVPYWKEQVEPYKDSSLLWHWIWCENGKRNNGVIYDIMRRTRHQYHYAVRRAKKNDIMYRRHRLAETNSLNNTKDMWGRTKPDESQR